MSLRTLFALLIALNLIVFLGGRMGWLGSTTPRGEPERLTNQLNPGNIRPGQPPAPSATANTTTSATPDKPAADEKNSPPPISTPAAPPASAIPTTSTTTPPPRAQAPASRPAPETRRCTAYSIRGQLRANEAERFAQGLGDELRITRRTIEEARHWRVRIPPTRNIAQAEQQVRDLREQGVADLFLIRTDGPDRGAISLGLYSTDNGARQRLTALRKQGVQNAEILPGSSGHYQLEFRGPASAIESLAAHLGRASDNLQQHSCTP